VRSSISRDLPRVDLNPADPVVASVALRVATKTGESKVAEVARTVLELSVKAAP
jgi:hypothetical protein